MAFLLLTEYFRTGRDQHSQTVHRKHHYHEWARPAHLLRCSTFAPPVRGSTGLPAQVHCYPVTTTILVKIQTRPCCDFGAVSIGLGLNHGPA